MKAGVLSFAAGSSGSTGGAGGAGGFVAMDRSYPQIIYRAMQYCREANAHQSPQEFDSLS